nr:immunoglobulin light chain junction region [Mus musculus]NSL98725.1 immunoglobulin light chain junction region [Mus musculus]NSL99105.1 immunoglobulin light chain junction region [Mus musculus]NSL99371.1 immunoglobulin light chain junction region [Mus musculus]NSM00670.1 immunoglobulin light chain junction region [Mus musculus]
CLQHGESPYTF